MSIASYISMPSSVNKTSGLYQLDLDGNIKQALARCEWMHSHESIDEVALTVPSNSTPESIQWLSSLIKSLGGYIKLHLVGYPVGIAATRAADVDYIAKTVSREVGKLAMVSTEIAFNDVSVFGKAYLYLFLNESKRPDNLKLSSSKFNKFFDNIQKNQHLYSYIFFNNFYQMIHESMASIHYSRKALAPVLFSTNVLKAIHGLAWCKALKPDRKVLFPYRVNDLSYMVNSFVCQLGDDLVLTNPTNFNLEALGLEDLTVIDPKTPIVELAKSYYIASPTHPDYIFRHSTVEFMWCGAEFVGSNGQPVDFDQAIALNSRPDSLLAKTYLADSTRGIV